MLWHNTSPVARQVVDVKSKILAEQGDNYPVAGQVLVFKGKVIATLHGDGTSSATSIAPGAQG